jgi:hypothetical protein
MKYFAALGVALLVIAAASVGPWAPSPFTSQTGTNTTAAAWRTALGAAASSTLSGYVTNHTGAATNLALTGGSVTTQTNTDLTASRVVVSSASKVLASSSVTSTTLGYLDATSSVQTQLDGKPTVALTNLALLNTPAAFTAEPTLNGFRTVRSVNLLATNLSVTVTSGTNAAANYPTNAGDYYKCGAIGQFTMPALPASWTNVGFVTKLTARETVSGNAAVWLAVYGGAPTNWLGNGQTIGASANDYISLTGSGYAWVNLNSHTNQIANAVAGTIVYGNAPANLIDTSAPWTCYVGFTTTGTTTTYEVLRLVIEAVNLD